MHPKIREIIDTSQYCRPTIREIGALLPADDAEYDEWLAEAVRRHDQLEFLYLVAAGMLHERPVSSRHLARGLQLLPNCETAGCIAWQACGDDVPEQLFDALLHGGIHPCIYAATLLTIAYWCKERGRDLPDGFKEDARVSAHTKGYDNLTVGFFVAIGAETGDERLIDIILKSHPRKNARERVVEASVGIGKAFLEDCRAPLIEKFPEIPVLKRAGFTVRRSVEHIGRNDACPCASGKKYKRCCFEKDNKRLQLSTDVAGKTYAEVQAELEEHMTLERLKKTHPHELARIGPEKLDEDLLLPFLQRLLDLGMLEEAVMAFEKVGFEEDRDDVWQDAIFLIAREGRKDLAERLMTLRGEISGDWESIHPAGSLLLTRDDPAGFLKKLEELSRYALEKNFPEMVVSIGYGLLYSPLWALGVLVARSALPVASKPEAVLLLDEILIVRDKLDLSPDEPFSDVLDKRFADEGVAGGGKDTEALRLARQKLEAKAGEVRQMKHALEQLKGELERREKAPPARKTADVSTPPAAPVDEKALKELRDKLGALKTDLKERHAERAELRRELSKTLSDLETLREAATKTAMPESPAAAADAEDRLLLPGDVDGNQPLRVIEFPKKFQQTLEKFPRQVGRGAMSLLGRLAGGEPAAFVGVVRLKDCPETLRARVGIDHRLLFRLQPDCVQVVDLINRRDLEKRIKTL